MNSLGINLSNPRELKREPMWVGKGPAPKLKAEEAQADQFKPSGPQEPFWAGNGPAPTRLVKEESARLDGSQVSQASEPPMRMGGAPMKMGGEPSVESDQKIRPELAEVIANKLAPGQEHSEAFLEAISDKMGEAAQTIDTAAGSPEEVNFETAASALAPTETATEPPTTLFEQMPEAFETFETEFLSGYGSYDNKNFQTHGNGIFSFEGGNEAQPDVTFIVDSTPEKDDMTWLVVDNSRLGG